MLTVVVPVHNVAAYLDTCLESLAHQTHRDLDVVLVDDGSTDGSGEIAAAWPARDPRFRLVRQDNRGLGAARNAGAALATGDYLAFVDADDVLPPYAFEVLVNALERTGSDFASGNVRLLTDGELTPSPLHRGTHRVTRLAADPRQHRYLLYDRLACNKVWRRAFWGDTAFPEGVHYEDIPVTVPLYGRARAVDVVEVPVYYWRQRPAGDPSISQRLAEPRNLEDRFAAVTSARRDLSDAFADWYAETALQSDLRLVLEVLPDTDDAYRALFRKLASAFLTDVDAEVLTRLPSRLATAWRLARDGDLDALLRLVESVRGAGNGMAAWRDPAPPVARAGALSWSGGRLRIGLADAPALALLWLRETASGNRAVLLPAVGGAGTVHASRLRDRRRWVPGEWTVNVAPPRATLRVTDPVALPSRWVDRETLVAPVVRGEVLRLVVDRPTVVAAEAGEDAGDLYVDGFGELTPGTEIEFQRAPGVPSSVFPLVIAGPKWIARVPMPDLVAGIGTPALPGEPPESWLVALRGPDGVAVPLLARLRWTPAPAGRFVVDATDRGVLRLTAVG
ncbi:glycosyltransferase [Asanoa iriomotensis]|uniref:Glycosyltransferase 2-like domain-containing protein n=1 Tax=Asanoa iriomotensis TaxID=234613 RepID=A0ABQ4CDA3_9ACTN|nr:glycosyltransferase [Asanoa iriomotensis]GIF60751.1 hypothetical protein Air01nite_68460 [Asanoa iriomotensis]